MITKELVEDAFIHLEDDFRIWCSTNIFRVVDDRGEHKNGSSMYEIFKIEAENIRAFYVQTHITLDSKGRPFYKFEEWNKINSEISTAIKRIVKDPSVAKISTESESDYVIDIPTSKEFQVENIDRLVTLCRRFNNLFSPNLTIFPQFHYDKGVVIYLREVLTAGKTRFQNFNEPWLRSGVSVQEYLSENFKFVKKFDTAEQVLQSNQFLREKTSELDKFIIYELEPLDFKVVK